MAAPGSSLRWYVKKTARYGVALISWGSGWLTLRRWFSREPRVRVLMYHRFRDFPYDPFSVSVSEFTEQMEWLAEHRLAISLDDFQAFLSGKKDLPDGSVLVTVDDGYNELWSEALPILQRLGIPAVAFLPAGEIASDSSRDATEHGERFDDRLRWEQVVELPKHRIAVGSHAWTHRSFGRIGREQMYFHARESRLELERRLQNPITAFAYPFGTRADFNDTTKQVTREVGYRYVFTAQHGAVRRTSDPYTLPRVKVEGGESIWMFKLLLRGAMDPWRLVDRFFWSFQQSEK